MLVMLVKRVMYLRFNLALELMYQVLVNVQSPILLNVLGHRIVREEFVNSGIYLL